VPDDSKKMLFVHGMENRYGGVKKSELESSALKIAQSRGYGGIEAVSSGRGREALLKSLSDKSISGVFGFSRGGNELRRLLQDPKTSADVRQHIKEAILVGSPETKGAIPGIPTTDIPYLKGAEHMQMVQTLAKTGQLSTAKTPQQLSQYGGALKPEMQKAPKEEYEAEKYTSGLEFLDPLSKVFQYKIPPGARESTNVEYIPGLSADERAGISTKSRKPRNHSVQIIEMTQIGQWVSWIGKPGEASAAYMPTDAGPGGGMGGMAAGAVGGAAGGALPSMVGGESIGQAAAGGAAVGGRGAAAGVGSHQGMQGPYGGPGGGVEGGALARARTPWHSTRLPGTWAGRRFPQAPGRGMTPFHDTHPGFHPGAYPAGGGGAGGGGIDRSRMRKELENNPELRKRVMTIAANENNDPRAQQAVMESMMNRALMSGKPLSEEAQFTWRRGDRGYYDAKASGIHRGQAAVADPRRRAALEKQLDAVLAGSNISNYATGNASGQFVENRIRQGMFPGGVRFRAGGETFVGESRGQGWKKWYGQVGKQGGGDSSLATLGPGGALPANQAARLGFQPIRSGGGTVQIKSPSGATWQVAPAAARQFSGFLKDLEATGYRATSSGGWNYRTKRGGGGLSQHAYGTAIDIDAAHNPFGSSRTNMPSETSGLARKWGLSWGGEWRGRKDPMHFEISRRLGAGEGAAGAAGGAGGGVVGGAVSGGKGGGIGAPRTERLIGSSPQAAGGGVTFTTTRRDPSGAVHGYLDVGGHRYSSVTGGAPGGVHVPHGDYRIGPREFHPKLHGSSYHLTGPQYRGGGGGLFFHRGGMYSSQGCFHLLPSVMGEFEKDLANLPAKQRVFHYK